MFCYCFYWKRAQKNRPLRELHTLFELINNSPEMITEKLCYDYCWDDSRANKRFWKRKKTKQNLFPVWWNNFRNEKKDLKIIFIIYERYQYHMKGVASGHDIDFRIDFVPVICECLPKISKKFNFMFKQKGSD